MACSAFSEMTHKHVNGVGRKKYKWLSYRRETALQGGLVLAKSGRQYSAATIGLSSVSVT